MWIIRVTDQKGRNEEKVGGSEVGIEWEINRVSFRCVAIVQIRATVGGATRRGMERSSMLFGMLSLYGWGSIPEN